MSLTTGKWARRVLAALGLAWAAGAVNAADPPPPAEVFYREAQVETMHLSPGGRFLAVRGDVGKERNGLAVIDLSDSQASRIVAHFTDVDIDDVQWVNDEWLVFDLADRLRGGGDQLFQPGLYAVHRDGTRLTRLIDPAAPWTKAPSMLIRRTLDWDHRLQAVPGDGSNDVIVGRLVWGPDRLLSEVLPLRLDVTTGQTRSLARGAPDGVRDWWFDGRGEPRLAAVFRDGRRRMHWRAAGGEAWRLIDDSPTFEVPWNPVVLDGSDGLFVTTSEGPAGLSTLRRLDPASGKLSDPIVRVQGFDFRGRPISETPGSRTLGLRLVTDAETTVWFDDRLKQAQAAIDARLPGHVNRLTCRRCDGDDIVILVESFNDRDPGRWGVYRPAKQQFEPLGSSRPSVDPRRMARLDFHRIRARDGLDLPVWVTTPAGPKPDKPRPAVVLVHGGPWVRGVTWGWNADAQFLASRGYVVIEPEFRGSTGYGQRHFRAGWKQWGLAMQDDLIDALDWAVAQGTVDPARVCIAGASYGGYGALMGVLRDGDRFKCAVAWVGVSDPFMMFQWRADYDVGQEGRIHSLPTLIGDPERDAEALKKANPLLRAAEIKAPLLLAYGGADSRVPPAHGTRLRDALRAAGRDPDWVLYPGEGHGWFMLETRLDFAGRMERFLARHVGR